MFVKIYQERQADEHTSSEFLVSIKPGEKMVSKQLCINFKNLLYSFWFWFSDSFDNAHWWNLMDIVGSCWFRYVIHCYSLAHHWVVCSINGSAVIYCHCVKMHQGSTLALGSMNLDIHATAWKEGAALQASDKHLLSFVAWSEGMWRYVEYECHRSFFIK
jgi:hypothetical protein